jgi:outer membrane biosynthesis protein TonB
MLGAAVLCHAQDSNPACDFSGYKPIVISHVVWTDVVKRVEPEYPLGGRVRVQSEVEVKIVVDRKGDVVAACATRGHPLLRVSAVQAAREWKFKPNFGFTKKPKRKYMQTFIVFHFKTE